MSRNWTDVKLKTSGKRSPIWKKNKLRIVTWNIMSWTTKDQEIINEESNNIEIRETKEKGKEKMEIDKYIIVYSAVSQERRGHCGVSLFIDK
ncbi:hypothetical protein Trydic_g22320 [Trypoxylus dichotomus]